VALTRFWLGGLQELFQQQPPNTTLRRTDEPLQAALMPDMGPRQDSVKAHSLGGPHTFDELLAFQSVKRGTNGPAFIADQLGNLFGAGKSWSVAINKSEYVPLTKQGNAQAS